MNLLKKLNQKLGLKIQKHGKNNIIKYSDSCKFKHSKIVIWGSNNTVLFEDDAIARKVHIKIGQPDISTDNCLIRIGKNSTIQGAYISAEEDGSIVTIGDDCLVSYDVIISCSDTHSIFDENHNLINAGKSITIGSHVWLCEDIKILKNTSIPDNSIVATGSIVTKKFETPNIVIAGNPAKAVKSNIEWQRTRPNRVLKNLTDSANVQ